MGGGFFCNFQWKQGKRYSSIDHLQIPLIILGVNIRPITDEPGLWEIQLITPMRLDPPVDVKNLIPARPTDLFDPAVDDLRCVVLEGKGYGLGLLLLLDRLRLLKPLGGASGVMTCLLNSVTRQRAGNSLG